MTSVYRKGNPGSEMLTDLQRPQLSAELGQNLLFLLVHHAVPTPLGLVPLLLKRTWEAVYFACPTLIGEPIRMLGMAATPKCPWPVLLTFCPAYPSSTL